MSSSVDEISSARNHCRSSKFLAMHLLSHHPMDRRYEMCEAGGALYHNLVSAMEERQRASMRQAVAYFQSMSIVGTSHLFASCGGEFLRSRSEEHTSELQSLMRI